ncbi:conjugal transfer relaxase TraA [Nephila pilipes]|uniref:Conjugal transfer relaxase TraA n=1 Tax=Nephila pilipes TaxID=299642 RepID=A0A8X6U3C6_NEPPI|nr:conjugal transfer relaxase TraA [Nephila pilipes]
MILHLGSYDLKDSLEEYYDQNVGAYYETINIGHHNYYMGRAAAEQAVKKILDATEKSGLIRQVLDSDRLIKLYNQDGKETKYYTTKDVKEEELRLLRIAAGKVNNQISTHKAVSELKSKEHQECDTVRGFLFKVYNGRVKLSPGSVLVVDEAGMVGNSDYLELLKIEMSNNPNLSLAGEERQLLPQLREVGCLKYLQVNFGFYELSDKNVQQLQIINLTKLSTAENINIAIQIYREKGLDFCILYSHKTCKAAIEKKIQNDLTINHE